jgi:hypothetical protein
MPILFADEAYISQFTSSVRLSVSQSITFATESLYIRGQLANGGPGNSLMVQSAGNYSTNVFTYGIANHSEGYLSTMSVFNGNNSFDQGANHIEGVQCTIFGGRAGVHAEGFQNYLQAMNSGHVEGIGNQMTGGGYGAIGNIRQYAHVEGSGSVSLSAISHVEGGANVISWGAQQFNINRGNHLEGFGNRHLVNIQACHLQGGFNILRPSQPATNDTQHVEGMYNTSSGDTGNHMQGAYNGRLLGMGNGQDANHVEGMYNEGALGSYSHIEGFSNSSSLGNGGVSHTEGCGNVNNFGSYAHVGGYLNASRRVAGVSSFYHYVTGIGNYDMTHSGSSGGFIAGTYCTSSAQNFPTSSIGLHRASLQVIIGGGVSETQRANIFEVLGYNNPNYNQTYASRSILLPGVLNSGPYTDDTAAGNAGVPIGGLYRLFDGSANNRVQIRVS